MHFRELLLPDGISPRAKFALRPSLSVLLYWQRYCTAHQRQGQPNFAAWYKEWNYGTFAEAPPLFSLAAITLGIGPHFSLFLIFFITLFVWFRVAD